MFNAEELNLLYNLARTLGEDAITASFGPVRWIERSKAWEPIAGLSWFVRTKDSGRLSLGTSGVKRCRGRKPRSAAIDSEVLETGKAVPVGNALDSEPVQASAERSTTVPSLCPVRPPARHI